jgi:hypothetical protein
MSAFAGKQTFRILKKACLTRLRGGVLFVESVKLKQWLYAVLSAVSSISIGLSQGLD